MSQELPDSRKGSWVMHRCTYHAYKHRQQCLSVLATEAHLCMLAALAHDSDIHQIFSMPGSTVGQLQSNAARGSHAFEPLQLLLHGLSSFDDGQYLEAKGTFESQEAKGAFESQAKAYAVTVCCQKRCRVSNNAKIGLSKASSLLHAAAAAWAGGVALQCTNFDPPERAVPGTLDH